MTKKDYIMIANVFKAVQTTHEGEYPEMPKTANQYKADIISAFMVELKKDNARFDSDRFLDFIYKAG